jgi:peroxiredoxin
VHAAPSEVIAVEQWAEVELGQEMADSLFDWQPPDDWARVDKVPLDEVLLQPGTPAPDFELAGVDGGTVRLSELRGKVVWLTFWKLGCPPCRLEMVALEALHRELGDRGLAVVGFNCMDELERARAYLADAGVTYRNVVDSSDRAWHVYVNEYTVDERVGGVPLNFIIDRDGMIVESWFGYLPDDHRGEETVRRLLDAA